MSLLPCLECHTTFLCRSDFISLFVVVLSVSQSRRYRSGSGHRKRKRNRGFPLSTSALSAWDAPWSPRLVTVSHTLAWLPRISARFSGCITTVAATKTSPATKRLQVCGFRWSRSKTRGGGHMTGRHSIRPGRQIFVPTLPLMYARMVFTCHPYLCFT